MSKLPGLFDLTGRVAVITGGVGLLGTEFCRTLAEAGAAVTIADLNGLGKHLDKEKGQDDSLNRTILNILDRISQLEGVGTDQEMEEIAIHASSIRNAFFDDKKRMEDIIPPVLLVKASYHEKETAPRKRISLKEKQKKEKEKG